MKVRSFFYTTGQNFFTILLQKYPKTMEILQPESKVFINKLKIYQFFYLKSRICSIHVTWQIMLGERF